MLAVLTTSCSIEFAYNNLDRFVRWQVSDYVDLTKEQRATLKRELAGVHLWHRRNHLPQYAEFAERLAVQMVDAPSAELFDGAFEQIFLWAEEIEQQAMPLVVEIMTSLSDEQVADLKPRLAASNAELAEDEEGLTVAEAQELWVDDFVDQLKTFTGRLEEKQRAIVASYAPQYKPQYVLWAEYRERFQAALLDLLAKRQNEAEFDAAYRALIARRKSFYGPELTAVFEHNQRLGVQIAVDVFGTLSPRQAERFTERLTELGDSFRALSKKPV